MAGNSSKQTGPYKRGSGGDGGCVRSVKTFTLNNKDKKGNITGQNKVTIKGIHYKVKGDVAEQLKWAGKKASSFVLLDTGKESAEAFTKIIEAAVQSNKYGICVDVQDLDTYTKEGIKLFVSDNGGVGFAITPDGDLISVFGNPDMAEDNGAVYGTLMLAVQEGATQLNCYDTILSGC